MHSTWKWVVSDLLVNVFIEYASNPGSANPVSSVVEVVPDTTLMVLTSWTINVDLLISNPNNQQVVIGSKLNHWDH